MPIEFITGGVMRSRGFTLIELLVVMTIGAILVAAAIPSMQWFIATTRASNGANSLVAAFELARSEAIRRGTIVSVCRTLDPNAAPAALACSNAAGGGFAAGDWGSGWVTFEKRSVGVPAAGTFDDAGGDIVLSRQQPSGAANPRLVAQGNLAGPAVAYNRFGMAASSTGTFAIDYRDPGVGALSGAARCVFVSVATGRVRTARPTASVCV
jgi:type IV fimbrial biogenesis protein FimT